MPWPAVLMALAGVAGATLWLAMRFKQCLDGYTGDCLGAVQQVAEVMFYLVLLAWKD